MPILTFCPVNKLPDLIYVRVDFVDKFAELYDVRRKVRKLVAGQRMFMEDIATLLLDSFPGAQRVTVALAFNRHTVRLER